MASYRNPWHDPSGAHGHYGPAEYHHNGPAIEHRGFQIYDHGYRADLVKDGVCLCQRVSVRGAKGFADLILDGPQDFFTRRALSYLGVIQRADYLREY